MPCPHQHYDAPVVTLLRNVREALRSRQIDVKWHSEINLSNTVCANHFDGYKVLKTLRCEYKCAGTSKCVEILSRRRIMRTNTQSTVLTLLVLSNTTEYYWTLSLWRLFLISTLSKGVYPWLAQFSYFFSPHHLPHFTYSIIPHTHIHYHVSDILPFVFKFRLFELHVFLKVHPRCDSMNSLLWLTHFRISEANGWVSMYWLTKPLWTLILPSLLCIIFLHVVMTHLAFCSVLPLISPSIPSRLSKSMLGHLSSLTCHYLLRVI